MLEYLAELHKKSTYPAEEPLSYPFETLGTGYVGGKCFAHWDTVHVALDAISQGRLKHARHQLLNLFELQQPNGFIPGLIYYWEKIFWNADSTWPPVWPVAVDDYITAAGEEDIMPQAYKTLCRQIDWFEANRAARPDGFYYRDILDRNWESGVDEGIRFDSVQPGSLACVDATSHVWTLYETAARWSRQLGQDGGEYAEKRDELGGFIQDKLYDEQTGFFYDSWIIKDTQRKPGAFEGIWPVVVGAATEDQASRVIDKHLLNRQRFLAPHPIPTVALDDPAFERRMWRGPAWNSMTYWAARGCLRYDRADAAGQLLERALNDSAVQFARTGTIWEFYDPTGGHPEELQRKPDTPNKIPCCDYTGHNPLHAMAHLYHSKSRNRF